MKLNLGCGKDIKKSTENEKWVNMDVAKLPGVDVVWNIDKYPWPFKANTFDEVYASHVLEHVEDFMKCLEELHRVCKKDAKIFVKVPIFPSVYAMTDPTHKHFITYFTFEYFKPGAHYEYYSKAKFNIVRRKIIFSWNKYLQWMNFFVNLHPNFYSRYLSFILPSNELQVTLQVVK
jgi:SAM-dependent methyltransferase